MLKEFREFIARGNVIDLAIAVVIGVAFGKIINTLVDGVIMPPIGLLLGKVDFSSMFVDLSGQHPASVEAAKAAGQPVIAYGALINDIISFLIVAAVVFLIIRQINRRREAAAVTTKDCPQCLSAIPIGASRCAACCADLSVA